MCIPILALLGALLSDEVWGKPRHIHTQFLWVQERVRAKDFSLHKERTDDNVGDLFTKRLDATKSSKFTSRLGYQSREGSASLTLKAA